MPTDWPAFATVTGWWSSCIESNVLGEVAGVTLDVDGVAHGQRVVLDFDGRHADLAEVMRDFAHFHFRHWTVLLLKCRVRPGVAAAQIRAGERQLRATGTPDPVPKLEQRNVKTPPASGAGNCHGEFLTRHCTTCRRRTRTEPQGKGSFESPTRRTTEAFRAVNAQNKDLLDVGGAAGAGDQDEFAP